MNWRPKNTTCRQKAAKWIGALCFEPEDFWPFGRPWGRRALKTTILKSCMFWDDLAGVGAGTRDKQVLRTINFKNTIAFICLAGLVGGISKFWKEPCVLLVVWQTWGLAGGISKLTTFILKQWMLLAVWQAWGWAGWMSWCSEQLFWKSWMFLGMWQAGGRASQISRR